MMRPFSMILLAAALAAGSAHAVSPVVRPAPNFTMDAGKGRSLRNFRGQAVVLVYARNARTKQFRAQVARLKEMYSQFATEKVVFVAALEEGTAEVKSDIPFAIADNAAQIAADYGIKGHFAIAVIGRDGNLDMITDRVVHPERVRDVIFNNYETQAAERKNIGL